MSHLDDSYIESRLEGLQSEILELKERLHRLEEVASQQTLQSAVSNVRLGPTGSR